jgi:DNA modification methylase
MKPIELFARAIKNSTLPDEIVYDPFLGSGTTLIAAEQLGRVCFGMEIDPGYTAVVLERASGLGLEPKLIETIEPQAAPCAK